MIKYCWNGPNPFGRGLPGLAHGAFRPEAEAGEAFSPFSTGDLPVKSSRPVGGSGVAGEQASRVANRFGGRREGRAHRSGGFHGDTNRAAGSDGGGVEE
jgi:hypothetical protein